MSTSHHADSTETSAAESPWQYRSEISKTNHHITKPVTWTASEFMSSEKDVKWFIGLGVVASFFAILIFLFTREFISPIMVVLLIVAAGVFSARKPRVLKYQIDNTGIYIADKFYDFGNFKSFAVLVEGPVKSISFLPLKRFMPTLTAYYPPEDETKILETLSNRLPQEHHELDLVDKLMRHLRF